MKTLTLFLFLLAALGTAEGAKYIDISQIQGSDHRSKFEGDEATTDGVVTRVYKDEFIIQSKQTDASSETLDALYIYQKDTVLKIGNELRVTGVVEEYVPGGEGSYNLSLTQIRAETVKRIRSRTTFPKPIVINYLLPSFPKIIKQPGSDFDPKKNALDFWESMEHMRVTVLNATVVGPNSSYGEIAVGVPQAKPEPATFNVENLYTGLPDKKFETITDIIIHSLKTPDILALQEIHDNSGPENNRVVDATETLTKLVKYRGCPS